ncbi:MAG: single-stranded-DNA-specific exonuclease RecJ [Deltaproteobacteria bacterium]|nr:single-stranded-DNA-specific exonuclease RecJ [Deltaproteobacteria bacterium]
MKYEPSYKRQKWRFSSLGQDGAEIPALAQDLNIPQWQVKLLGQRQLLTADKIRAFMQPTLESLPSPFLFKEMNRAVRIFAETMSSRSSLVIVADYDVDGVTAAAVLARFFTTLGLKFSCLHPNRFKDGYGLKAELVRRVVNEPGLVITADCGISDAAEVETLKDAGWRIIITDHHQPPDHLPPADAILNPWLKGCGFPFNDLAGVGVAFYLVMGIRNYLVQKKFWLPGRAPNLKKILDLVAVGTIADMVKLHGVNRTLAKAGLDVIDRQTNEGLRQLIGLAGVDRPVNAGDISFQIAPRLNAAGRLGEAGRASELLTSNNRLQAGKLAAVLDQENTRRKEITGDIVSEAMSMAQRLMSANKHCLVLHGQAWHEGLIGIAASKLVNQFYRPTIILTGREILRGSARSIPGVDIHVLLKRCDDLLIAYGGHSAAAGLSINIDQLAQFNQRLEDYLDEIWPGIDSTAAQIIDMAIKGNIKIHELIEFNQLLQPFGQGNPEPVYCPEDPCRLRNIRLIGKERSHVRFDALINGEWLNVIGFGFGKGALKGLTERRVGCRIAFHLQYNTFRGQRKLQLQLLDFIL